MIGITGINGFIGSSLGRLFELNGFDVVKFSRNPIDLEIDNYRFFSFDSHQAKMIDCSEINEFFHVAGHAHGKFTPEMGAKEIRSLKNILISCKKNGVKKFIYISSASVYGKQVSVNPIPAHSRALPSSEYGKNKLDCENLIKEFCKKNDIIYIIIRIPIVIGLNAPGNAGRLQKLITMRMPLPFKSLKNKKSIIFLDHLTGFLVSLVRTNNLNNNVFLVCTKKPISTKSLIQWLANELRLSSNLFGSFDFPIFLKKNNITGKLIGNLEFTGKSCVPELLNNANKLSIFLCDDHDKF